MVRSSNQEGAEMLDTKKLLDRHQFANASRVAELVTKLTNTKDRQEFASVLSLLKVALSCAECGENFANHKHTKHAPRGLQFAHIDRTTKLRTKSGKAIHPSKIIADGYSLKIAIEQTLILSRVLCANCHALETAAENSHE